MGKSILKFTMNNNVVRYKLKADPQLNNSIKTFTSLS